jgi:hypothetical protein
MNNNANAKSEDSIPVNNNVPVPLFANERVRAPCPACQQGSAATCVWYGVETALFNLSLELVHAGKTNSQIRYALYQKYTKVTHGTMGRGNRVELPACVEDLIKESFPNTQTDGTYKGFRMADETEIADLE